jgi:peptide deformylase
MVLEIKKYPDPVLRKKAGKIEEVTPEIKKLGKDMIEIMQHSDPEGAGLAGPQVGVSKRIIVALTEQGPAVFVNPQILKKSRETEVMEEGCLSLPGVLLKIKRAKEVELEHLDIEGKKSKIKVAGIFARILQHEIDHLDGILIIDKDNFWQKIKSTFTKE